MLRNYFDGSYETMVSYMVDEEQISDSEITEIKKIIDKKSS
jgi:predicted transcriptional regulator